jgi:hypothetical protein
VNYCFYRVTVTGDMMIPPALEVIVTAAGEGTLVNVSVKTPTAKGITGPI